MLPPAFRLRRAPDFRCAMRSGRRASRGSLVVHLARVTSSDVVRPGDQTSGGAHGGIRVGFVVSRAVGGSVVRHRVTRRLRAIVAARLDELAGPDGVSETLLVVRALPSAAHASSSELAHDLDAALVAARRTSRSPSAAVPRASDGGAR